MKTKIFKSEDTESIRLCGELIQNGEIVAFPTETVYGLGASALNDEAVSKIFAVKNRPQDNPLIAHVDGTAMISMIASDIPPLAERLFEAFSPGPLTVILPAKDTLSGRVTAGGSTVAVRCPSHPLARALITAAGVPIVAPSANLSGKPSPTEFETTFEDLNGKVAAIIDGGSCSVGVESTVVLPENENTLRILRPGAVTPEMLKTVCPNVILDKNILSPIDGSAPVLSPGMKHRHYAPKAPLTILSGSKQDVLAFMNDKVSPTVGILCFEGDLDGDTVVCYGKEGDALSQSQGLFHALRQFDKMNITQIYARPPETTGVGLAVYNRLLRAAEFQILEV